MVPAVLGCRKAFISTKCWNNFTSMHQMLFDPVNLWKEKSLIKKPKLGPPLPLKVEYSLHCPGLNDQLLLKYKSTGKIIIKKLSLKFSVRTFVAAWAYPPPHYIHLVSTSHFSFFHCVITVNTKLNDQLGTRLSKYLAWV